MSEIQSAAEMQRVYYLKDEGLFDDAITASTPEGLWLLLYKDQTSTWLSSYSHVTQRLLCNIFKQRFCRGLVFLQHLMLSFFIPLLHQAEMTSGVLLVLMPLLVRLLFQHRDFPLNVNGFSRPLTES